MKILTQESDLNTQIQSETILVVQYGAQSCAPCHALQKKLTDYADGVPGVSALYIPTEDFPELVAQGGVFTVPTIFVYVQGKLTIRESGYFSLQTILDKIDQYRKILYG